MNLSPLSSQALLKNTLITTIEIQTEIFSVVKFIDKNTMLFGTQMGTIYQIKMTPLSKEKPFKVLMSFNYNSNFLVTDISVMPSTDTEDVMFAACFADGAIKIFSIDEPEVLFEFQSMNVDQLYTEKRSMSSLGSKH